MFTLNRTYKPPLHGSRGTNKQVWMCVFEMDNMYHGNEISNVGKRSNYYLIHFVEENVSVLIDKV